MVLRKYEVLYISSIKTSGYNGKYTSLQELKCDKLLKILYDYLPAGLLEL